MIYCKTCKWWLLLSRSLQGPHGEEFGDCRSRPPHYVERYFRGPDGNSLVVGFPVTNAEDFCGEWTPKAEP